MARVAAGEGVDGASSAGTFRTGTSVSCARPDPPRRRHTAWGVVLVDMVVLLCECKRGTPRPRLEKRCSPFRVEAAPDGAPGWRRDPGRSSGLSHASGGPRGLPRMNGKADAKRCTSRRDADSAARGVVRSLAETFVARATWPPRWSIQVQVTTANASPREWTGSRTTSRRRLATSAVPVRTPTGSLCSLPLLSSSRKGPVASVPCTLCRLQPYVLGLTF